MRDEDFAEDGPEERCDEAAAEETQEEYGTDEPPLDIPPPPDLADQNPGHEGGES